MGIPVDDISTNQISRDGISADDLARELDALGPRWTIIGGGLHLAVPGPMSRTGVAVAFIGTLADELDHHPRIALDRHTMTLSIRTDGAEAVTLIDLVFAARVEQWLRGNGWPE
jgi:pterin-4a-carbinolamine dehydratase